MFRKGGRVIELNVAGSLSKIVIISAYSIFIRRYFKFWI